MVKMKRGASARVAKAKEEGLCVACLKELDTGRTIRGCHERCARATTRAIEAGHFTEEQRIAEGKLCPAETGGRPPSNPVSVEAYGEIP
jgi:hypothetical protein|tara:strand:- start:216 stop:482 length:267 start_codon:yes stop_codon:yes gene_type:complete